MPWGFIQDKQMHDTEQQISDKQLAGCTEHTLLSVTTNNEYD
jgi:hypothetical protein